MDERLERLDLFVEAVDQVAERVDPDPVGVTQLHLVEPLIGEDVTVEHLLAHRSGIGDYFDEEAGGEIDDYVMTVPLHRLATTEQFIPELDGHPAKFPAGQRFSYCNGGYAVLALIAERAGATPFHDLVGGRVCGPAGMHDTEFLRSDEPDERVALGYLAVEGLRTNACTCRYGGAGTAGSTPRSPTLPGSGRRCSPAASCRRTPWPTWSGPEATSRRCRCATAWGFGWLRLATS